jgi:EAL domain-containing protein (putative c-di-GMP-specific phosphodiesterase class I)
VARRILERLQEPFLLDGKEAFTGASIGIASASPEYASAEEILRDADTAMYRAKALGRSCYVVFDAELRARAVRRLELEQDLRKALERGELVVYYQPKIELGTGALCGFEALLRWRHPRRGLLGPAEFIPIAEETGLIVPIGLWVLREACRTLRSWLDELAGHRRLEVSVNVSARQFRQPDLVDKVAEILAETGLPPERLQLEITETVLMEDRRAALSVLERLKALGVGLKIDDFGTGYSSLNCLSEFPFDSLKIDRSFVLHLGQDDDALEVIKAILSLGETLRLEVVAEGIETATQLEALQELGCRFGQGYYFAAPLDPESAHAYALRLREPAA